MTEVTAADETVASGNGEGGASGPAAPAGDERLAHRGPFQRLLSQPEIGAVIGAMGVWAFFWAVTTFFGTAGGAQGYLDVSATLGIMAVAVALLMIGGEFDLSAGALTGATGLFAIYLALETAELGGAGLNLWLVMPISLAFALGVGWINGTLVEKTALPSFIVTLASFFILRGLKLGFAKLLVGQIQVGPIPKEGNGYDFWQKIFAATWNRNEHQFGSRDLIYTTLTLLGVCVAVWGLYELNFARKRLANPAGLGGFVGGGAVAIAGYVMLHQTDGVGANWLWSGVLAVGAFINLVGLGIWRYERSNDRRPPTFPSDIVLPLAGGLVLIVLGVIASQVFDSTSEERIFLLLTEQGLRALLFVGLSVLGLLAIAVAGFRAGLVSSSTRSVVLAVATAAILALAFVVKAESTSVKFRAELFTVMLVGALLVGTWSVTSAMLEQRAAANRPAEAIGLRLAAIGVAMVFAGITVRLLFTTVEEIDRGLAPARYSVRILWFLAVTLAAAFTLARTRFGSWVFAVGGNKAASRQVGVPAARTKTQLFMTVSAAAWLVGMLLAFRLNTLQAGTGDGEEFEYIIAAVVGGNLLTGGYGSAIGAAVGALIMAMSIQGIPAALWNSDWRFVFLGVILLLAVVGNKYIKEQAQNLRKMR